jgi:hypothetical protein
VRTLFTLLTAAALGIVFAVVTAPVAVAQSGQTVVMSGLDNPRGLAFRPGDDDDDDDERPLYVAEAGRGGTLVCVPLRGTACVGSTGAVSRLWRGRQERIVTGLPSYAPFATGAPTGALGPQDVAFAGRRGYVVIGLAAPLDLRAALVENFGWIARFRRDGTVRYEVDVSAHEQQTNPDQGPVESNPNGLLKGAGRRVIVDAAANTLLQVDEAGLISTLAVFPSRPQGRSTDAVPTSVARGPDGAYYVGELTGAPFTPGLARVWRVVAGHDPEVLCDGFSFLIDLAFDRDGNLYVLEASGPSGPFTGTPGRLLRVAGDCGTTEVATELAAPTSLAIGPDGDAYVSVNGTSERIGAVVRVDLPREHDDDEDEDDEDDEDDD